MIQKQSGDILFSDNRIASPVKGGNYNSDFPSSIEVSKNAKADFGLREFSEFGGSERKAKIDLSKIKLHSEKKSFSKYKVKTLQRDQVIDLRFYHDVNFL